jgi:hypothetical protein
MVVSKYSQNHFISEKYKTVPLFKLNFLQCTPLVHLCTSASDRKGAVNIPGSNLVEDFSALTSHSLSCQLYHKGAVPSMLISVEGTGKAQQQPGQESMGDIALLSHCSLLRYP